MLKQQRQQAQELHLSPEEIVKLVTAAYDQGIGVFNKRVNAEDFVPRTSKRNKAQFLFWII